MQEFTKDFVSHSTKQNVQVLGSPQRRSRGRGRDTVNVVFNNKSLKTVSSTVTLLLCLLSLRCFHVYAFQPSPATITTFSRQQPTMMRLLQLARVPSSVVRSLHEEALVTKSGRCTLLSSSRLYSSVATTNTAVTTTTTTTSNVADTTSTVVELKYMDYLPHHDSSGKHSPIVFLHGLLGNKKNFATIATSLGNQLTKKRRIIGLDLRNHGTFYLINPFIHPSILPVNAIQKSHSPLRIPWISTNAYTHTQR